MLPEASSQSRVGVTLIAVAIGLASAPAVPPVFDKITTLMP